MTEGGSGQLVLIVGAILLGVACSALAVSGAWIPLVVVGGFTVVLLGFYQPALLVLVTFTAILNDAAGATGLELLGLPITASKLATAILLVVWVARATVRRDRILGWTPVSMGLLLALSTTVASLAVALQPAIGFRAVASFAMCVVLVHIAYQATPVDQLKPLLRWMTVILVPYMAWSILFLDRDVVTFTPDQAWQIRGVGSFGDPNDWSTALITIGPILLASLTRDRTWTARVSQIALVILLPICVFQSMSRAGFIAFVLIIPGLLYILRGNRWILVAAGVAMLALLPSLIDLDAAALRYGSLLDPTLEADLGHGSLTERRGLLKAGVLMLQQNWLTGVGVGMYRFHAAYVTGGYAFKVAHNTYLSIAAEQGVFGALAHLYLFVSIAYFVIRSVTKAATAYHRTIAVGALVGFAGFAAMAATLNLETFALFYFILGIVLVIGRAAPSDEQESAEPLAAEPA